VGDLLRLQGDGTLRRPHRVTVSPYRRRRKADEPFDLEVESLDELR